MNHKAIYNTHPNVIKIGDACFDADGNPVAINQSLVDAEVARLQSEQVAQEYARNRQTEYPPIGDQLDALFHAGVFPADMAAQLQAVKDKYPR